MAVNADENNNSDDAPVLLGIATESSGPEQATVKLLAAGAEWCSPDTEKGVKELLERLAPFHLAARASSKDLPPDPGGFYFQAGQIFYRDQQIEEVRLAGILADAKGPENAQQGRAWATATPPRLRDAEGGRIALFPEDEGRTHFSARVVHDPGDEQRLAVAFLWDLRENAPSVSTVSSDALLLLPLPPSAGFQGYETLPLTAMPPVEVPHRAVHEVAGLSPLRGLGRHFIPAKYRDIPDLDRFTGNIPREEAKKLFLSILEEHLDGAASSTRRPSAWWERTEEGSDIVYILHGMREKEARSLWDKVGQALNASNGGPGIVAAPPGFKSSSHLDAQGEVAAETHLILWPAESLQFKDGRPRPPVYFRNTRSPSYQDLLVRHENRPFKADGWLWLTYGNHRDGYRLAGRANYLFEEGLGAMASLERLVIQKAKTEIQKKKRSLRGKLPFREMTRKVEAEITQLREDIRRAENHIVKLTTFDIWDILLSVLFAFRKQRNAWAREELVLADGRRVKTTPYRVIRLDPQEMKVLLQPKGRSWRTLLWQRLQALEAFERTTWTRSGRQVDSGDRFLQMLLDGCRANEELQSMEEERGLWKILRQTGAIPSQDFFAVPSPDFIDRCFLWEFDEGGKVLWGEEAAHFKASRIRARNDKRKLLEDGRSRSAYYYQSQLLVALANREGWPPARKLLITRIQQNRTPEHEFYHKKGRRCSRRKKNELGGAYRLRRIEGKFYEVCRGSDDRGYKVEYWIRQGGYARRRGPGGGVQAYRDFVIDLRYFVDRLSLRLQLEDGAKETEDVLSLLEATVRPSQAYELKLDALYPVDMEEHVRQLMGASPTQVRDQQQSPAKTASVPEVHPLTGLEPWQALRVALNKSPISQGELAGRLGDGGVSRSILNKWLNGKRSIPDARLKEMRAILAPWLQNPS